jgi:hypothetical protein
MKLRLALISATLMLIGSASTVLAGHPGRPDNIWTGPPPEACTLQSVPVHDINGTTYLNQCHAALVHVRVTWDGVAPLDF